MSEEVRKRIGRWNDIATRQIVYESDLGIEVDELDHFEIVRRRVFYDDILLVTMHKEIGAAYIVTMAIFFFGFLGLAALSSSVKPLMAAFLVLSAIVGVLGILRMILGLDIITVFGRRSRAAVRYGFRKDHARQVFEGICAHTAAAQRRRAEEIAASEPPPPPIADDALLTAAFPPPEQ